MTAVIEESSAGGAGDEDLEKITELQSFGPERVDGVDFPANGYPTLMLKGLGTGSQAGEAPAATPTSEGPITTEPTQPDPDATAAAADAGPPADQAVKAADGDGEVVTVGLPADATVSMSPAGLARLDTHSRQLALADAALKATAKPAAAADDTDAAPADTGDGEGEAAKRDMDRNVGGGVDRDKLPDSSFVFPDERDFPVVTPGDVSDAASSWDRYKGSKTFAQFKSALTALARRKGKAFVKELPASWTAEGKGEKAKARQCPECNTFNSGDAKSCKNCGHKFGGAAGGEGDGESEAGKETAEKGMVCKGCGFGMAKGSKFCANCGAPVGGKKTAKAAVASPADAKVGDAITALEGAADTALAAQAKDPDATTHAADTKVTAHLEDARDAAHAAADAQAADVASDDEAAHESAARKSAADPAYHVVRLHDATCAALRLEDVTAAHPVIAKGIGEVTDPAAFGAMVTAALLEDGGTGSRAWELPGLSAAYGYAVSMKAAAADGGDLLDQAMADLRKAFADMYPDAHPKPGSITPGEFTRPYISSGRANQHASAGQHPRVPLSSHVPEAADFRRTLITSGREAASPGSKPSGVGKLARTYYTNAGKDQAATALAAMHDYIAGTHPMICPMSGPAPDREPAQPNTMGSTLTIGRPSPEAFGATKDKATPVPVTAAQASAAVTPGPAVKELTKEERRMAKAARRAEEAAAAAAAAVAQTPVIDPEMLKSALREVVAEQFGDVTKTISDLTERVAEMESAPDPEQMTPRSAAALIAKRREDAQAPEVPAGGDGAGVATERVMRLMKRIADPDGGVRVAAIGELTELVGRETAAELLAAAS